MIRFGVKISGPLRNVVVPDEDMHIIGVSHPKHLSLIATPLATAEDIYHDKHSHPDDTLHETHGSAPTTDSATAPAPKPIINRSDTIISASGARYHPHEPVLKRAHEASTIQLFFDLFFVANLTTFSTIHEVDTWSSNY